MRLRGEVSDGRAVLRPGYVCRGKGQHGRVRPDLILEPWGRAERWDFSVPPSGLPQVRFLCGVTEVIRADRWTVQASGGQLLSRQQLPLQLAWAISIHKSQGMSLDCVEISLGRVFASGQAYVALSRARSLQGLRVLDFDPMVVRCDPRVLRFYATLRQDRGLSLESPHDNEAASDQENVDPNL